MKEIIKKIEKIAKTDKNQAVKMLSSAFQAIDKAAQKGVIKKNNAARKKSRLSKLIK
ncbi:MAG: 30S ribosomal protein S20 [Parcubacteria group bacterium Gr01-1014_24]|nr:MAG: 30S ribosomal protein S20 [Parcubacteria group bacterium Gr01-1014_24]